MRKTKINLEKLAVKSFVTNFEGQNADTLKGGSPVTGADCTGWYCGTDGQGCKAPTFRDHCTTTNQQQ